MHYSRRALLTTAGSLATVGLAGCGSQGSSDGGSNGGNGGGSGGSTATPTPGNQTSATATATPVASPLVRDTRAVFEEAMWFTTQYSRTIFEYQSHVDAIATLVGDTRAKAEVTASDVEALRSRSDAFISFLESSMAPHFSKTEDIVTNTDHYVGEVEKFRQRNDPSGVDDALARFRRYYDGLAAQSFLRDRFSGRPIGDPLYSSLLSADLDSNNPAFSIGNPASPALRPCRLAGSWNFDLLANSEPRAGVIRTYLGRLDILFGGVDVPSGRTGRLFIESFTANGPRRSRPIYIQGYPDQTTAEAALSAALDSATSEATTDDFGRPTWHRVFYTQNIRMKFRDEGYAIYDVDDGRVYGPSGTIIPETNRRHVFDQERIQREQEPPRNVYTHLSRIGPYLVAVSPSTLAWGERPDGADDAITNTWLWT